MTDASKPVSSTSRAWKTDHSAPGKSRRSLLLGVLLGLITLAGVSLGILYWLSPPREPAVLPLVIATNPDGGPVAWLEADRAALADGGWLGRPLDDWAANPHRDQIRLRFRALSQSPRWQPVVAYLAAPAAVDAVGGVYLLPADKVGDHPRNRLPLAELLSAFKDCPAKNRLLILQLVPRGNGDLSAAVFKTLDETPDAGRLCLIACGPGQVPLASPELGRTALGWYLETGLRGAADGWAGDSPDGRVTVNELAAYVRSKVGAFANATRDAAQTPVLVGSAPDFTLRALARGEQHQEKEANEITFPDWLRAGWERHDKLNAAAPPVLKQVRELLLAAERDLLAGKPPADVQRELDRQFAVADQLAVTLATVPTPDPLPTLAAMFPGYSEPDLALVAEMRAALRQLDSRSPAPAPTPEPPIPLELDAFKAKPHAAVALAAFVVLSEDAAPSSARVRGLSQLLAVQSPTPRFAETNLIRRLADLAASGSWSPSRTAIALQAARLFEDVAARPDVYTWAKPAIDRVYQLRADAEAVLFAPGYASTFEADRRLREAEVAARKLKDAANSLRAAGDARNDATASLVGGTELVNRGAVPIAVAEQLVSATRTLGDSLVPPAAALDLDSFTARVPVLERNIATVRAARLEFTRPIASETLARLKARAVAPDADPSVVRELDTILATPLLATSTRAELWNARAAINHRLAAEVLRKDATEAEAIRKDLARLPVVNPREPVSPSSATPAAAHRFAGLPQSDPPGPNREAVRAMWAWQGARFEYEARESDGVSYSFALVAARACRAAAGAGGDSYLEVTPAAPPRLTLDRPSAALRVGLRAVGAPQPSARIRVLSPADGWVTVGLPTQVALNPLREASVSFAVAAGDNPVSFPGAKGVLVEAEAGGRTYHRRVPVSVDDITDRLTLFARTALGQPPVLLREIRVRPNGTLQPFQLLLANPTPKDRKVFVRLAGLGREVEVTVPAGKTAPLLFPAPPPVPAPPGQPAQAPPVDEGVALKGDELVLELFDAADRDVVKQTIRVPVAVANPAEYLLVTDPVLQPASGARPNRLSITVVPGDIPPGGPLTARLGFPERRNPGLVVRDGNLTGPVSVGGSPITLYAENLALPGPGANDVWVTVSADGVERVLTYFASLPSLGETIRLAPVGAPRVFVKTESVATGTSPLPVTLEVDNAPPGATLEFVIGTATSKEAPVVADLTQRIPTAKDTAARVKFDPKGEALILTGSIRDHEPKLPVELLFGLRVLEARLLDRAGKEIAKDRAQVTFDGTAPKNVQFLDSPVRARKDQPLAVRATCDPTISGIKEVKFFVGRPQGKTLPQNPPPVSGKLFDEATNEWRGSIPVEGLKGTITVGVQFTTKAGLASEPVTFDVELVDAADLNKPEPGKITGTVIELRLPQKDRAVFLYDDKKVPKDKKVTNAAGNFEFPNLVPGTYYLYTENDYSNAEAMQQVEVKPGETKTVTLEVLLRPRR